MKYVRLDGSLTQTKRAKLITTFNTDPSIRIFLITIAAGGVGLNLTAASNVFVMEPQYNPGVEQQAVDRVHRIGQTRETHIYHLVMENSIEKHIVQLQEKKMALAALTLNRKLPRAEVQRQKLAELKSLFRC
jgi:SNF2 family DNA or RNA helicase